jgi:uncharacterized protein YaiL (DUF2058 family)
MKNLKSPKLFIYSIALVLVCSVPAFAQKYKTAADTAKLNVEYSQITLDIAKLNEKLVAEKNKTNGYETKSVSATTDAASAAQDSKEQSAKATNGDLGDAKSAMKMAKKSNNDAKDAKNAMDDKNNNLAKIQDLNNQIAKKKAKLAELDAVKASITNSRGMASTNGN